MKRSMTDLIEDISETLWETEPESVAELAEKVLGKKITYDEEIELFDITEE